MFTKTCPSSADWAACWAQVDLDALDCISANLGLLLQATGLASARRTFGSEWHFDVAATKDDGTLEPILSPSSAAELCALNAGVEVQVTKLDATSSLPAQFVASIPPPVLVIGDAFHMPWLPYFERRHMEHSAIVAARQGGRLKIVDAYTIKSEWGEAHPTVVEIGEEVLRQSFAVAVSPRAGEAWTLASAPAAREREPRQVLGGNASRILDRLGQAGALGRFARSGRDGSLEIGVLRSFVLSCWLIARSRKLHARWLRDLAAALPRLRIDGLAVDFEQSIAAPWEKASQFAYLSLRRASDGRAPTAAAFDMIEAELAPAELSIAERFFELFGDFAVSPERQGAAR